ncbi:hypothetical protein E4U55_000854, partial [Claviceps digitariae]
MSRDGEHRRLAESPDLVMYRAAGWDRPDAKRRTTDTYIYLMDRAAWFTSQAVEMK